MFHYCILKIHERPSHNIPYTCASTNAWRGGSYWISILVFLNISLQVAWHYLVHTRQLCWLRVFINSPSHWAYTPSPSFLLKGKVRLLNPIPYGGQYCPPPTTYCFFFLISLTLLRLDYSGFEETGGVKVTHAFLSTHNYQNIWDMKFIFGM